MLAYEEAPPPAALAPFIRCFWSLRGNGDPSRLERILPDGSFELIFHRGTPFIRGGQEQPRAMLVGEIRRATLIASSRQADVFGIRFRLGGFGALTGLHARAFRDEFHDLRDVLREDDPRGVVEILTRRGNALVDRRLTAAVSEIVRRRGNLRIALLADAIGTSERTLERLFDSHVGVGPKELARLARFQASLRGIDSGYYDDAHRIHEYRELAGATPAVLEAERSPMTDAFVGNLQDDGSPLRA